MDGTLLLAETELILNGCSPAEFDTKPVEFAECIAFVCAVEDDQAWRARYASPEEFYAAHEPRHPDIRLYGAEHRARLAADPATAAIGPPSQKLTRRREQKRD